MRHIVCRFKDEAHFFRHLSRSSRRAPKDTISFLGDFDAANGDAVRLTLVVDNQAERYDLVMKVTGRRPSTIVGDAPLWRYEAIVTAEDAVWLEMFASKLAMMQRMYARPMGLAA